MANAANQNADAKTKNDARFSGSIPELYERYLVPLIFQSYADDLARRIKALQPQKILETAAGTGVVTRALSAAVPGAEIVATDLNQPMLEFAKTRHPVPGRVIWQQANALTLPFEDAAFDVVTCQFGAMFFPDKVKAYSETNRVLKPEGRFFFSVWDEISTSEFADVVTQALADVFPHNPPKFLARTPHGHGDGEKIRADLKAAGFSAITIDAVEARSKAPSPTEPAIAYCQGTPLRGEIEALDPSRLQEATDRASAAIAARFGNGPVDGRIRAFVITATR